MKTTIAILISLFLASSVSGQVVAHRTKAQKKKVFMTNYRYGYSKRKEPAKPLMSKEQVEKMGLGEMGWYKAIRKVKHKKVAKAVAKAGGDYYYYDWRNYDWDKVPRTEVRTTYSDRSAGDYINTELRTTYSDAGYKSVKYYKVYFYRKKK